MELKEPLYNRFVFVWGILTAVYLLTLVVPIIGGFVLFVGLFVPFGIWNTFASLSLLGLITFTLIVLSFIYGDKLARKLHITHPALRFVYNLVWLFLLTFIVDFIIWQRWESMSILLQCPHPNMISDCGTLLF